MTIDDFALARAVHVLSLVHWIGGVAVVATIILPRASKLPDAELAIEEFEAFERRFASQARVSVLLAGASGVYMLMKLDAWDRLRYASFWWLHLMIAVWAIFALMIYVLEPLLMHRLFRSYALQHKNSAFALVLRLHAFVLLVSALAIVAGVLGAHGGASLGASMAFDERADVADFEFKLSRSDAYDTRSLRTRGTEKDLCHEQASLPCHHLD